MQHSVEHRGKYDCNLIKMEKLQYKDRIVEFSVSGFQNTGKKLNTNGKHSHVLQNKYENFFGERPKFKLHRWAGSLKSSQAFAYNIFSGIKEKEFEYPMRALDSDPNHRACIDVAIKSGNRVDLYEVKMFEIVNSKGINKIFHTKQQEKYLDPNNYVWNVSIANDFIAFIKNVQSHFLDRQVYGEGLKQLCCHLLGIINEVTIPDGNLQSNIVNLHSLCFDKAFSPEFHHDIENYKNALQDFKFLTDKFLKDLDLDSRIKYQGFLSAEKFIIENQKDLGIENFEYVLKRYYK